MMKSRRVLYIEADERRARAVVAYLESDGIEVHILPRLDLALLDITRIQPHVTLVSQTLASAIACAQLQGRWSAPIVVVGDPIDLGALLAQIRTPP